MQTRAIGRPIGIAALSANASVAECAVPLAPYSVTTPRFGLQLRPIQKPIQTRERKIRINNHGAYMLL